MKSKRQQSHRAFTLIELLVVIGIIAILVSILLPLVMRSYRQAGRIRAQADLQTISTALEAYKQDHGDIPRIPIAGPSYLNPGKPAPNLGAAILCKALLGPYGDGRTPAPVNAVDNSDPQEYQPTVDYVAGDVFRDTADPAKMYVTLVPAVKGTPSNDVTIFARYDPHDGADGIGFRKRLGGAGPVSPAYLAPGKITFRGSFLLDHYGGPILYFPANPRKRDLTDVAAPSMRQYVDQTPVNPPDLPPLYNADDNFEAFARRDGSGKRLVPEADPVVLKRIRIMLGDYNTNGYIDSINGLETAITNSYLLWTPGPDGVFGPIGIDLTTISPEDARKAVEKCDDIVNFR